MRFEHWEGVFKPWHKFPPVRNGQPPALLLRGENKRAHADGAGVSEIVEKGSPAGTLSVTFSSHIVSPLKTGLRKSSFPPPTLRKEAFSGDTPGPGRDAALPAPSLFFDFCEALFRFMGSLDKCQFSPIINK